MFKLFKRRSETARILLPQHPAPAPADNCLPDRPMRNAEKRAPVYVVYPAALFEGWEVVKERDDNPACFNTREEATSYAKARAVMDGGGLVKLESWFGDTEKVWEVQPQADQYLAPTAARSERLSTPTALGAAARPRR